MNEERLDLPQGTLDLLILKAVSLGPMHGWAISERIRDVSKATLQIPQGSLYPALHRLERRGWISAEWGSSDRPSASVSPDVGPVEGDAPAEAPTTPGAIPSLVASTEVSGLVKEPTVAKTSHAAAQLTNKAAMNRIRAVCTDR